MNKRKFQRIKDTVELTGFVITQKNAFGQIFADASAMSRTMPALVLKRSSRVMPGKWTLISGQMNI